MSPRVVCITTPSALSALSAPVDGALFEGKEVAVGPAAPPDDMPADDVPVEDAPAEDEVGSEWVSLSFLNMLLSLFIFAPFGIPAVDLFGSMALWNYS